MSITVEPLSPIAVDNALGIRSIWTKSITGGKGPGIFAAGGLGSHGWANRQKIIHDFCLAHQRGFVSFANSGMHHTTRDHFFHTDKDKPVPNVVTSFNWERWIDDGVQVFKQKCKGPQIVVVNSFLSEIGIHLASMFPDQVAGLIVIAPAVDPKALIERHFKLRPHDRKRFEEKGYFDYPMAALDPFAATPPNEKASQPYIRITKEEVEKAIAFKPFIQDSGIWVNCPVSILYSEKDPVVLPEGPKGLAKRIISPYDVELHDIDNIGHAAKEEDTNYPAMLHHLERMIAKASRLRL